MRMTVFGVGGVGGYLAARLATAPEVDLSVVARGKHLQAIQEQGLRLESPMGDLAVRPEATDDPRDIGHVDVVFLTVKGTDVPEASERMRPLVGPDTAIVTFQNGIDSPSQVSEALPGASVLPGLTYIFSTIAEPGVVQHTAGPARYVFGEPKGAPTGRADGIGRILAAAGVDAEVVEDVDLAMWSKFIVICSTAGVTAPSRLPIHVLREDPATWALFVALVEEAAAVGRAAGVALGDEVVESALAFIADIGPGAYSSLLYDLVNGKPMELETLHGTILRLADEFGVDVPSTRTIYALLSPWARHNAAPTSDVEMDAINPLASAGR